MFVQHMLAVLKPGGMAVTVMPHGVLFRGGAEKDIRTEILNRDLLEAVIGLAPNLFYGTGIPACILVLRAPGAKPRERQGKVLFINADREYYEGRAQNYLQPEHIEKIVSAWEAFEDVPGFAQVVSRQELRENDDNLNIRRYADNAPPPEPHDVRAHLHGGVPKAEVKAKKKLFEAHGLKPGRLLKERDERYLDFVDGLTEKADLKKRLDADEGMATREKALTDAVESWWKQSQERFLSLPKTQGLMPLRAHLLTSFEKEVGAVGLLDRFQVTGVIATWWGEEQNDLKALAAQGFRGLVEAGASSIVAAMEDENSKENPLDHPLTRHLLPQYLAEISELEAKKAELEATLKGSEPGEDEEEAEEPEEQLSEEETKNLKKELGAIRKKLRALQDEFKKRLEAAVEKLDEAAARKLVLAILRENLDAILGSYVLSHRQQMVSAFETWWDKYRVTLMSIEQERKASSTKLMTFLESLGYDV